MLFTSTIRNLFLDLLMVYYYYFSIFPKKYFMLLSDNVWYWNIIFSPQTGVFPSTRGVKYLSQICLHPQ